GLHRWAMSGNCPSLPARQIPKSLAGDCFCVKRIVVWAGSRARATEPRRFLEPTALRAELPLICRWPGSGKSEVMELAEQVGVPKAILQSSRRADPACGRPQEMAEIPFEIVDRFLQVQMGERSKADLAGLEPECLAYLEGVYRRNRFKADLPV